MTIINVHDALMEGKVTNKSPTMTRRSKTGDENLNNADCIPFGLKGFINYLS
jgi:hypothetical protein